MLLVVTPAGIPRNLRVNLSGGREGDWSVAVAVAYL